MATLILGTVGRALGGPLGGLVGTVIGSTLDRGIFGGGATREGPRVANLAVQSAAYGEPLPRIYGRMRVAGSLVWTAGIRESRTSSSGGKRGAATSSYSYSASFAVIVAARAIVRVERIWADGKLLRATDGTLIYPATIRAYTGSEGQLVDPLIAAAEGVGAAPAYRDRAHVVFEDLPLADYGNRIPNLTFEVVADDDDIAVEAIARDIAGPGLGGDTAGPMLLGFAAARAGSIRATMTQLAEIGDLVVRDADAGLVLGPGTSTTIPADVLGASEAHAAPAWHTSREAGDSIPDALVFGFSDPARDFQPGQQRAVRRSPVLRSEAHDLPVAATAAAAKQLAEILLRRAIARRSTALLAMSWRYAALRPGDAVLVEGYPDPWRVRRTTITGAVIECEVERIASPPGAPSTTADSGRVYAPGDAPNGPTVLHVLDLPSLDGVATTPRLLLAAAGPSSGWRRAGVVVSRDGGASYATVATIDTPATLGVAASPLPAGTTDCWDRLSTIDVDLLEGAMTLESASEAAVLAGANLALAGDEVFQFARAEAVAPRRYRLSVLLRGRRGTEAAVATHAASERFVMLDAGSVTAFDPPIDAIGSPLIFKAVGPGEDIVTVFGIAVVPVGVALRPLSPVALTVTTLANGDRLISWIRRSRAGFAWIDGADAPLGEEAERYRVTIAFGATVVRAVEVGGTSWTYPAASFAADGGGTAGSLTAAVAQLGAAVGPGSAATCTI
ncbi:phage tail protein [Polymorphobacter megasporae]|uniref:phage tail protein n=1 Tax=Glacieibacterium megasporae TaxID=2835787 RepID=UPI001C1E6B8E|nr:phage tail protein [Polymorphobacter megasporae]UAJ08817.1 phage tail protein [Polymorphobacter megasporae]